MSSSINIYDFTVPQFIHMLSTTKTFIQKGVDTAPSKGLDASTFPDAKLAADMKPLTFQIQIAASMAKRLCVTVADIPDVKMPNEMATFEDMNTRIDLTVEYLRGVKREDFDGKTAKTVEWVKKNMTALDFTNKVVLPNFYFHVTAAYAILRNQGIDLGKMDFLGAH